MGSPAFIAQVVTLMPILTSDWKLIDENKKLAFFSSLSLLYANAFSVLSKKIAEGVVSMWKIVGTGKDRPQ